jgi:TetR/AcrR family transcriptional regulator, regulator of cefoperazone and chloramphenicol sensitivity
MRNRARKLSSLPVSARREGDRSDTRARVLLEAAGHIFAEKGFDRATGKEICERAGINAAAVNYYFGGIEGLYAAVLEEAHGRLLSYQVVSAAVAGKSDAKAKLRALAELIVRTATGPASSSWMLRVVSREFLAPTAALDVLRQKEIPLKARIIAGIVSELMGLPEDHPAVARGCFSVLAQCAMLLIGDRRTLKRAFPTLGFAPEDADALVHHLMCFALAGLAAVGRDERDER